jgi:hypothetical protein
MTVPATHVEGVEAMAPLSPLHIQRRAELLATSTRETFDTFAVELLVVLAILKAVYKLLQARRTTQALQRCTELKRSQLAGRSAMRTGLLEIGHVSKLYQKGSSACQQNGAQMANSTDPLSWRRQSNVNFFRSGHMPATHAFPLGLSHGEPVDRHTERPREQRALAKASWWYVTVMHSCRVRQRR